MHGTLNYLEACQELKNLDKELWSNARQEIWKGMFFADPAFSDEEQDLIIEALVDYTGVSKSVLEKEWNKTKFKFILEEPYNDLTTIIVSSRFLKDLTDEALEVLGQANNPPSLFTRGGLMVRVKKNGDVVVMNRVGLSDLLDRNSSFVKVGKQGNEPVLEPAFVPEKLAINILELTNTDNPPTPQLDTISTVPVFTKDKKLLLTEGYHPKYNTLLRLDELKNIRADIPIDEAKEPVDEFISGFPFTHPAGRAHVYAALLQAFARLMIKGPTPLYVIDASTMGTGKTLLCDGISLIVTGQPVRTMSLVRGEEEREKRVTATLLDGAPIILLDNVTTLGGETLAAVLTSEIWQGRKLGKSEMRTLRNNATWLATGNNVEVCDDLPRRVIPIRLDAGMEKPYERKFERNLKEWIPENRSLLVSCCLSILQHHINAGSPKPTRCITLGSYESWVNIVGGAIEFAGIDGFLEGREHLQDRGDTELNEWRILCEAWYERKGSTPILAKELLEICRERNVLAHLWVDKHSENGIYISLGKALNTNRDRVFGEWVVRYAGKDKFTRNHTYKLEVISKK